MPVWLEIIAANAILLMAVYIRGVNKELRETKAQLKRAIEIIKELESQ